MSPATEPTLETTHAPPPAASAITPPQTGSPEHQRSVADLFEKLRTYPFITDREFATGLAIILGHPDTFPSEEEIARDDDLVLQAKCYYFTRKENLASPLNVAAYKSWLVSRPAPDTTGQASVSETQTPSPPVAASQFSPGAAEQQSVPASQEPSYPNSFAHIVELITTSQPIPGIQQIPDTLLTGQGAASAKPRRRKPWEKEESSGAS
ncbi:DUF5572 domain-containing protein [Aspergillus lucknowensis]|uniref:Uncharacterized protein n=1 Tax=Aspergillus lucknowensis TaxID=176173 RepID=A0ABR4LH77_9EURO